MNEAELQKLLETIEASVAVFQDHKGPLTALEVSVKSMLLALRIQVADQLMRVRSS